MATLRRCHSCAAAHSRPHPCTAGRRCHGTNKAGRCGGCVDSSVHGLALHPLICPNARACWHPGCKGGGLKISVPDGKLICAACSPHGAYSPTLKLQAADVASYIAAVQKEAGRGQPQVLNIGPTKEDSVNSLQWAQQASWRWLCALKGPMNWVSIPGLCPGPQNYDGRSGGGYLLQGKGGGHPTLPLGGWRWVAALPRRWPCSTKIVTKHEMIAVSLLMGLCCCCTAWITLLSIHLY